MIIVEKNGKRYEVLSETLQLAIEEALSYPDMTAEISEHNSDEEMRKQEDEPIVAKMVAILKKDNVETSELLGTIMGWTQEEFDSELEARLERVRQRNPDWTVTATEA